MATDLLTVAPNAVTQDNTVLPLLRVVSLAKSFGAYSAVSDVSLDIAAGEFFALLGPSGCGKTTLLRMLAGFETPDSGQILLEGADMAATPPHLRPVNMMFQNYALFPHLDVAENIAFGLRRAGLARDEIEARVGEMLSLTRLQGLERRKPDQLSGGQRQRVALARSLARRPRLLLLDEPLGALDRKLREETQAELKQLQRQLGMTFIVVTHDQDEAMTMADRIGVMDKGRLVQVGAPRELYETPASRWIASFIGDINIMEGLVMSSHAGTVALKTSDAGNIVVTTNLQPVVGMTICIGVRPEKIRLSVDGGSGELANAARGVVEEVSYLGGVSTYRVRHNSGALLKATVSNTVRSAQPFLSKGQRVMLSFSPDACIILEK